MMKNTHDDDDNDDCNNDASATYILQLRMTMTLLVNLVRMITVDSNNYYDYEWTINIRV